MTDPVRQRVLDAVADGRLPRGGPSHLRALGFAHDQMPDGYWARWNAAAAERIKSKAERPRCVCGVFVEPGLDGRCKRCAGVTG